jgi:hypothetical protein
MLKDKIKNKIQLKNEKEKLKSTRLNVSDLQLGLII